MWCVGVNTLQVNPSDGTALGINNLNVRGVLGLRVVTVGECIEIPTEGNRNFTLLHQSSLNHSAVQVASCSQLLKELQTRGRVVQGTTVRQRGCPHGVYCLAGRGRISTEADHALIFGLQQVGPIQRNILNYIRVDFKRHSAVVVTPIKTIGVLQGVRDRVPGRNLVGLEQPSGFGLFSPNKAYVNDVRVLRASIASVSLDSGDFVTGTAIGVEVTNLQTVLGEEGLFDFAIVCPVVGERDDVQATFFFRGGNQSVHPASSLKIDWPGSRGCW